MTNYDNEAQVIATALNAIYAKKTDTLMEADYDTVTMDIVFTDETTASYDLVYEK